MSQDDSHYFYVLHQIEDDFHIDHDELLQADRKKVDYYVEKWFKQRTNITGNTRKPSEEFKEGVFNWKEAERELEFE
jgi:hypothetical protein